MATTTPSAQQQQQQYNKNRNSTSELQLRLAIAQWWADSVHNTNASLLQCKGTHHTHNGYLNNT